MPVTVWPWVALLLILLLAFRFPRPAPLLILLQPFATTTMAVLEECERFALTVVSPGPRPELQHRLWFRA